MNLLRGYSENNLATWLHKVIPQMEGKEKDKEKS
jgi:hypothetical protein